MNNFQGKNLLITGGSSGIGLALAKKFSSMGANIRIVARNKEQLIQSLTEISTHKISDRQTFGYLSLDVADEKKVQRAVKQLIKENFVPDVLINSAGVVHPGEFLDLNLDKFKWMMDVNYFGTVNIIREILPKMIEQQSGTIVNISSVSGFIGIYGYTAYSGSKYAVRGFTDALRSELKPFGIHVAIVFPPDTDTPQLAYENQFKPYVTKQLGGSAGSLSPDKVADVIINGIKSKKYIILPGIESKLIFIANNLLGRNLYPLIDFLVNKYRKQLL